MAAVKLALYVLATVTCLGCTVLLSREYARHKARLLLWSALCFVALTVSNLLLFLDRMLFPDLDLRLPRLLTTLAGMLFLLYGFIWEADG